MNNLNDFILSIVFSQKSHIEWHVQHNIAKLNIRYLGLGDLAVNIVILHSLLIWVSTFTLFYLNSIKNFHLSIIKFLFLVCIFSP